MGYDIIYGPVVHGEVPESSFHFLFRWKFLFPPADVLYTDIGPGIIQPFECPLEPLLCLKFIRPENSVRDIMTLCSAENKEGKPVQDENISPHQVIYIFPDLMCPPAVEIHFGIGFRKTIMVLMVPVTKQQGKVFACKPVQPVFFFF